MLKVRTAFPLHCFHADPSMTFKEVFFRFSLDVETRCSQEVVAVVHTFVHRAGEAEPGQSLVQGQPGLQSKLPNSQDYTQRNPVLKNQEKV